MVNVHGFCGQFSSEDEALEQLPLVEQAMVDYGNEIGQGQKVQTKYYQMGISYMLAHNLFADLKVQNRNTTLFGNANDKKNTIFSLGFRWNTSQRHFLF